MTFLEKLSYSLMSLIMFILFSNPEFYNLLNSTFGNYAVNGCPTAFGHVMNTLLFMVALIILMMIISLTKNRECRKSFLLAFKYSLYSALVFYFVSNKEVYSLVNRLPLNTININGCPTDLGLVVHSLVYGLIMLGVMHLPKDLEN